MQFFYTNAKSNIPYIKNVVDDLNTLIDSSFVTVHSHHRTPMNQNIIIGQNVQQLVRVQKKLIIITKMFEDMVLKCSAFYAETQDNKEEKENVLIREMFAIHKEFIFGHADLKMVLLDE